MKLIRTDRVHYPGFEDYVDEDTEYARWKAAGRRLQPIRDTGLHIQRPALRDARRRQATRRNRLVVGLAILGIMVAMAFAWQVSSDRAASSLKDRPTTPVGVAVAGAQSEPTDDPSPLFASYGKVHLRLPVSVGELTEVGFHQAAFPYALHLKCLMPAANMTAAKRDGGTGRDASAQEAGTDAVVTGSALVMWRDRPGKPDTAVDVGAPPGTTVLAPLSGTVVLVKKYSLYGKHPDVRVHIQPEGHPGLDLVLIHIENPTVKAGDRVVAGVTPIGAVRKMSDKMALQLRSYTGDPGDHVHIQLNNAKHPDYEGLEGAIAVSAGS